MKRLILASQSSYRADLLRALGISFEQVASNYDETNLQGSFKGDLKELAKVLAFEKAQSVANIHKDSLVIGSDQVGDLRGELLTSPGNHENAYKQLSKMQGKSHKLHTALCILSPDGSRNEICVTTTLKMRPLSHDEITRYLNFDRPFDCAGSYKLESLGISLMDEVDTPDYTAIIGMPMMGLAKLLRAQGFLVP